MAIMHDKIKELRSKRGMTLAQIADALGTTEATAQRYESGKGIKSIPYEVIEKYANIFGCRPQYLLGWEEEQKKPANDGVSERKKEFIERVKQMSDSDLDRLDQILRLVEGTKEGD